MQFQRKFQGQGRGRSWRQCRQEPKKYKRFLQRSTLPSIPTAIRKRRSAPNTARFRYPETYVIKERRIMRKFVADQNWTSDDIEQYIQSLL